MASVAKISSFVLAYNCKTYNDMTCTQWHDIHTYNDNTC